jgi:hypothetical protein
MLLQTTYGQENFQSGSSKTYLFTMPTTAFPGKEVNVAVAAKDVHAGIRVVQSQPPVPAATGMVAEVGKWTTTTYEMPEGRLLKLFMMRNTPDFGTMRVGANLLLRVRSGAALRRVGAILVGHPRATYTRAWTEGRFDILSVAQARALGAAIPRHFEPSYDQTMVSRGYEIVEIEPEHEAPPVPHAQVVTSSRGEEVVVTSVRRRRALEL